MRKQKQVTVSCFSGISTPCKDFSLGIDSVFRVTVRLDVDERTCAKNETEWDAGTHDGDVDENEAALPSTQPNRLFRPDAVRETKRMKLGNRRFEYFLFLLLFYFFFGGGGGGGRFWFHFYGLSRFLSVNRKKNQVPCFSHLIFKHYDVIFNDFIRFEKKSLLILVSYLSISQHLISAIEERHASDFKMIWSKSLSQHWS